MMNTILGALPSPFPSASKSAQTPSQVQATARPMPKFSTFYQNPRKIRKKVMDAG